MAKSASEICRACVLMAASMIVPAPSLFAAAAAAAAAPTPHSTSAHSADLESVEGAPRLLGSGLQTQTLIVNTGDTQGQLICHSDVENRLRHLTDLVVRVSGIWQRDAHGDKRCFEVAAFSVLRTTSGHGVAVGILQGDQGHYWIGTDGGQQIKLNDIPDGLRKLRQSKVIVDLGAGDAVPSSGEVRAVIAYRSYP